MHDAAWIDRHCHAVVALGFVFVANVVGMFGCKWRGAVESAFGHARSWTVMALMQVPLAPKRAHRWMPRNPAALRALLTSSTAVCINQPLTLRSILHPTVNASLRME
jgi:hypothetical protein